MSMFDKIKDAIWGTKDLAPSPSADPVHQSYLGTDQATTGIVADVSTPANDPVLRDIAAGGVQAVSKPRDIEAVQNPTARNTEIEVATPDNQPDAVHGGEVPSRPLD